VPYYITFNRYNDELQAFQLVGDHTKKMELSGEQAWLGLKLGWRCGRESTGVHCDSGYAGTMQRGIWFPTQKWCSRLSNKLNGAPTKRMAEQRANQLAQRLRDLGLEP